MKKVNIRFTLKSECAELANTIDNWARAIACTIQTRPNPWKPSMYPNPFK